MATVDPDDDSIEHFTDRRLEPGYRRRHEAGHLLRSAIRHGVSLPDAVMDQLDLPSNMAVLRSVSVNSE
jgi:hypothetical protein